MILTGIAYIPKDPITLSKDGVYNHLRKAKYL